MAQGIKITFGGKPVYHVNQTLEQMDTREHAKVDRFNRQKKVGYCNSFFSPLGQAPCKGWLLMKKKDVVSLATSASHILKIEQPQLPTIEFKRLLITHAEACFNATDSNDLLYVVEIADRRWYGSNEYYRFGFRSVDQSMFNLPAELYPGEYHEDSLNVSLDPYTWQEMIDDLWPLWLSGTAPTLPYTPDGEPIGFDFRAVSPYEALGIVMARIGCALRYKSETGEYEIERVGVLSGHVTSQDQLAETNKKYLEDELHYYDPTIAVFPKGVVVKFHKRATQPGSENVFVADSDQWLTGMVYIKEIAGTATNFGSGATVLDNTYAELWDELPAETDPFTGTVANTSAIDTRAQERADKFYEALCRASTRYREAYGVAVGFEPSGICRGVAWRTGENGELWTERYNHPRYSLMVKDGEFVNCGGAGEDGGGTLNRPPVIGPLLPPMYPYQMATVEVVSGPDGNDDYELKIVGAKTDHSFVDQVADALGGAANP